MLHIGQQAAQFIPDHRIAFARMGLQSGSINYRDVAAAIADESGVLQFSGGLRNSFPAHTEHAGDQFLRDDQIMRWEAVKGRQQPAA